MKPFDRFGKEYFGSWLTIFPNDYEKSTHINGIDLDSEIFDEFEENKKIKIPKEIEIHFECDDVSVEILPKISSIKELKKGVKIISSKAISKEVLITVKAILKDGEQEKTNEKIGQLFIYPNNEIKNIDITIVDCLINDNSSKELKRKREDDLANYLNNYVLNQALIQCKVKIEDFDLRLNKDGSKTLIEKYDLDKPSITEELEISGKKGTSRVAQNNIEDFQIFRDDLMDLYEKKGKNKNSVRNKSDKNKFMFFLNIFIQHGKKEERFYITKNSKFGINVINVDAFSYFKKAQPIGNSVVFFTEQVLTNTTIAHEFGHNLGLWHLFDTNSPYNFYKGHTDNFMDYGERIRVDVEDSEDKNKNKRLSYFKWQWDEMREGL